MADQTNVIIQKEKKARGNIIYSEIYVPKAETEETANEMKCVSSIPDVFGIV